VGLVEEEEGTLMRDIAKWQAEFFSGPKVWATWFREDGIDELGSLYESEEAAQLEVEFCKQFSKRTRNLPRVASMNIHTLKLSKERWVLQGGGDAT